MITITIDPALMQLLTDFSSVPGYAFAWLFLRMGNKMQRREAFENRSISFRRALFINIYAIAGGLMAIITFAATTVVLLRMGGLT